MPVTHEFSAATQSLLVPTFGLVVNRAVSMAASPVESLAGVVALSGATAALLASPVTSCAATVSLSGSTAAMSAAPITVLGSAVALSGSTHAFRAVPVTGALFQVSISGTVAGFSAAPAASLIGNVALWGGTALLAGTPTTTLAAAVNLTGASDTHGMSVCDVVDQVLGMWGMFCRSGAPDFALARAISDLNHGLQLVWNNADGRNYWTNETLTIQLAPGESSQDLGDDVQNVVGPCRLESNRQPLTPIGTIGELETFSDLYLDGEATSTPVAYHIERTAQSGTDPAKCVFHVNSAIDGGDSVDFLLEVVKEAPRFSVGDLRACPLIPIPHQYVETLLMPVVRWQAAVFYLFRQQDQKETLAKEYQQAMVSLGLADPINPETGDNKRKGGNDA